MLIKHAGRIRGFGGVVPGWFLDLFWRGQAFPWRLCRISVQGGQQALASLLVEGQAIGTLGQMILDVLVALGEFFHPRSGAVEVSDHFILITVDKFLNVVQLTLRAVRHRIDRKSPRLTHSHSLASLM